jgi:hypothetical protein
MDQKTSNTEGTSLSIRKMPNLPLRAGRHITAWVLWHAARVSLDDGALPAGHSDSMMSSAKRSG